MVWDAPLDFGGSGMRVGFVVVVVVFFWGGYLFIYLFFYSFFKLIAQLSFISTCVHEHIRKNKNKQKSLSS